MDKCKINEIKHKPIKKIFSEDDFFTLDGMDEAARYYGIQCFTDLDGKRVDKYCMELE